MIEEKARQSLENNSRYFSPFLGEPRRDGDGFVFSTEGLPLAGFRVRYDIERKFLGRIYVMGLEGSFSSGEISPAPGRRGEPETRSGRPQEIELRYSGFLRKGRARFVSLPSRKDRDEGGGVVPLLNGDSVLIEQCRGLEVEFLRIFFDGESWKVRVRPYGGSFIKVLLPPLQYHVPLGKEQAERILSVMKTIAGLIVRKGPES